MRRIMVVLTAIVILVSTVTVGTISQLSPSFTGSQYSDTWLGSWTSVEAWGTSSWKNMPNTYLQVSAPTDTDTDVTITFSAELFAYYWIGGPEPSPDVQTIEVRCAVYRRVKVGMFYMWVSNGTAQPGAVVMLMMEPSTIDAWHSVSFTFIRKGLVRGNTYQFRIQWRIVPAGTHVEAHVRDRTLVVTLNTAGH